MKMSKESNVLGPLYIIQSNTMEPHSSSLYSISLENAKENLEVHTMNDRDIIAFCNDVRGHLM